MNQAIKRQLGVLINFVIVMLLFKGYGIIKSSISSFFFMLDMISISHSIRTFVYLITLIVPFIFLVNFLLSLQKANRNNEVLFLKDAFEQLKIYFILLIGSKVLLLGMDLLTNVWRLAW